MFKNIYVYLNDRNMADCSFDRFLKNISTVNANVMWILNEFGLEKMKRNMSGCIDKDEKELVITDSDMKFGENVCVVGYGLDFRGDTAFIVENLSGVTDKFIELVYARFADKPYTVLETKRFLVREITVDDLPKLYELYASLADCEFVEPLYEYEEEKAFTINYIENMYKFFWYGLWLVFDKQSGELVGRAGLENRDIDGATRVELGYLIGKRWQKKGCAFEVTTAIIDYARDELGIEELFVCSHKNNIPSISLAAKLGFEEYAGDIDGMNLYYKKL